MKTFSRSCARVAFLPALLAGIAVSCVSPESPLLQESAEGCDEMHSADVQTVEVDESVRGLMLAASDFSVAVDSLEQDVYSACANVALDLGASDTWSNLGDDDAMISNADGTGACDQAAAKIDEWLPASAQIDIAINYAKGYCYVDYQQQLECDTQCTTETNCVPGPVETRCEPGSLMVKCEAECAAEASCVGSMEQPANCMGKCESECQGECKGTCFWPDGKKTENDPNCRGKCSASCNGLCRGECKIDAPAGVECGANVHCKGACTSTYTDPVCVSECGPPQCTVEQECHDVCTSRLWANPVCVPTTVTVWIDVEANANLEPLRATLEANLPPLIDAAEQKGKRAVDALDRLADAGAALEGKADDFDGKSLACAGEATATVAASLDSARVSVDASTRIVVMCDERAQ